MISRGNSFPRHSPSRVPAGGTPPPIFHPYVIVSLHKHDFIGQFEARRYGNLRNKNRKSATTYQTSTAVDPAKRGTKRTRTGPAMLSFRTEHCQLATRARSGFLFGNERLPLLALGFTPSLCDSGSHKQPGP